VLNRCPTKRLKNKVPEEVWSGKKPSVNHLRVFGSICYKHFRDARRKKLDDKCEAMILVGYHKTGAYRLYNPISGKIMIGRDIVVDENESWNCTSNSTTRNPLMNSLLDESENEEVDEILDENVLNTDENVQSTVENVLTDRPHKTRVAPTRLQDCEIIADSEVTEDGDLVHFALLADAEPINHSEALKNEAWKSAMLEELASIERNNTWKLVKLPADKKTIEVKWVYKLKHNPDGSIAKHKARLAARGFLQKVGLDYSEVYAPVARIETVRLVMALACKRNWSTFHLDVKSAFLNGPIDEIVFVTQPPGFVIQGKEDMVYILHKALYGLKQAPRAWNKKIDSYLIELGFTKCKSEYGVYVQAVASDITLICPYVDNLLVTGNNINNMKKFKQLMMNEFEMTDLGNLSYFLGMEFIRNEKGIILH